MMEFLSVFADTCHHGKEEDFLFPGLEAAGIPNEGGPSA
jgi:hemerythrin-like domain-containing protein